MDTNKVNDYFGEVMKIEGLSEILYENLLQTLESNNRSFNPLYLADIIHDKLKKLSTKMDNEITEEF